MNVQFSAAEKDALARLLLLNSHIDAQNQAYFEWKEPFNTLLIAAKAARKKEGSSSYDKPSSTMGCSGEPAMASFELLNRVSDMLFEQCSPTDFIPEPISDELLRVLATQPDYIL